MAHSINSANSDPLLVVKDYPETKSPTATEIPIELIAHVLTFLDLRDVGVCSQLNHRWNLESKQNVVWKNLFSRNFPDFDLKGIESLQLAYKNQCLFSSNIRRGIYSSYDLEEGHKGGIVSSIVIADDKLFSFSVWDSFEKVKVWDIKSGKCTQNFSPFTSCGSSLAVDEEKVFLGGAPRGAINVFDLGYKKWLDSLNGHSASVECFAVAELNLNSSNKTKLLFSGSSDRSIKVWDLSSLRHIETLQAHITTVTSLAVGPKVFFSGSLDGEIIVWNSNSLQYEDTLKGHTDKVTSLIIANGMLFSASKDGTICVWDIHSLSYRTTLKGHTSSVSTLAIVNNMLISASLDCTIRIWDINSNSFECIFTLYDRENFFTTLAIYDRKIFANADSCRIKVFDFAASHSKVFEEIANLFKSQDHEKIKRAEERFSCMPQDSKNKIFDELCKIHSLNNLSESVPSSIWSRSLPLQKAQAITSYLGIK